MTSPAIQTIGDWTITSLSDGHLPIALDLLAPIPPEEAKACLNAAGITDPEAVQINAFLARTAERTILIDAGAGGLRGWGGDLQRSLAALRVSPGQIDTILLTHAHPDHIGGLLDADGHAAFPNAELVLAEAELGFWQDDGHLSRAPIRAKANFALARTVFERYRPRLRPLGTDTLLPGITAVPLPGHTAGHTGYRFDAGRQSLLVWGDIVHFPEIQIPRPEVTIAFDQDPALAVQTRRLMLDLVASDNVTIAGMHLRPPEFGTIERVGRSAACPFTHTHV